MGTRADFYVGRGKKAEWLGSIAWDGYPTGIAGRKHGDRDVTQSPLLTATTEESYRALVSAELAERDDATTPDQGWPWPWLDSRTTDYAYAFDGDKVFASKYGGPWFEATDPNINNEKGEKVAVFPNMKSRQNVTFGNRSGVMILGPRK